MQHFLNHPLSERLHGYVKRPLRTESRGVDFTELPPALKAEALAIETHCPTCGWFGVHPIRERAKDAAFDRRTHYLPPFYYSGTCPHRRSCSRGTPASADMNRVRAWAEGKAVPAAQPLPARNLFDDNDDA